MTTPTQGQAQAKCIPVLVSIGGTKRGTAWGRGPPGKQRPRKEGGTFANFAKRWGINVPSIPEVGERGDMKGKKRRWHEERWTRRAWSSKKQSNGRDGEKQAAGSVRGLLEFAGALLKKKSGMERVERQKGAH